MISREIRSLITTTKWLETLVAPMRVETGTTPEPWEMLGAMAAICSACSGGTVTKSRDAANYLN